MCVGEPMRVLRQVASPQTGAPLYAECEGRRGVERVDLALVGAVGPGEHLLVFLGAARARLTAQEADEIRRALAGLAAVMRGEAEPNAFADLENRSPALPPHLEAARRRGETIA